MLRVHRQGEKRSGGLHKSIENSHLHAEGTQTRKKNQVDFTKALRTVTYALRVHRQGEKIRWTSQKHWEQSLTCWECTDKEKRSGELHRSIENCHLRPEGAQTRRKDQVNFTEALRTVTYILRVHRQGEKIRSNSWKHQEQSLTCWECTDKKKRSGELHRSIENSHLHPEGAQTRRKDQVKFMEVQKHLHFDLCTAFICALYYQQIVSISRILSHSLINHLICQQSRDLKKGRE